MLVDIVGGLRVGGNVLDGGGAADIVLGAGSVVLEEAVLVLVSIVELVLEESGSSNEEVFAILFSLRIRASTSEASLLVKSCILACPFGVLLISASILIRHSTL